MTIFGRTKKALVDTRGTDEDERFEPAPAPQIPPPVARSIVGSAVVNLHRALMLNRNSAATLQAEIDAKTEAHRQTSAVVRSVELALLEMLDDDALTDDERALIQDLQDMRVSKALEAAEAEIHGG